MIVKRDRSQCIYVSSSVFDRVIYGNREGDTCAGDFLDFPGQCFLAAVFPCISCENREEMGSIWQESRRKMVRIRCNEPVTVYGCRL